MYLCKTNNKWGFIKVFTYSGLQKENSDASSILKIDDLVKFKTVSHSI